MNLFRGINESMIDRKARATDDAQVAVLRWGALESVVQRSRDFIFVLMEL
jgi:hypothetical protein